MNKNEDIMDFVVTTFHGEEEEPEQINYHPIFDTGLDLFQNVKKPRVIGKIKLFDYLELIRYKLVLDPHHSLYDDYKEDYNSPHHHYEIYLEDKYINGELSKEYDDLKVTYPSVAVNATFHRYKNLSNIKAKTNLMFLDMDGFKSNEEALAYRDDVVKKYDWIIASTLSISKIGLHFIILIDKILDNDDFNNKYNYISNTYFDGLLDPSSKSITRFTIIPYDNNPYINYYPNTLFINNEINEKGIKGAERDEVIYTDYTFSNNNPIYELNNEASKLGLVFRENLGEEKFISANRPVYKMDGIDIMELNFFSLKNRKINEGKRHPFIGSVTVKLIYLNGEKLNNKSEELKTKIYHYVLYVNKTFCNPPMEKKEVYDSFNRNWERYVEGNLDYSKLFVKRRAFWSKDNTLKGNEKRKITCAIRGELVKRNSIEKMEKAIEVLKKDGVKITQKNVAKQSGLSIATVKNHWKEFKSKIKEHNLRLKNIS